jgi:hypothetical protein
MRDKKVYSRRRRSLYLCRITPRIVLSSDAAPRVVSIKRTETYSRACYAEATPQSMMTAEEGLTR